MKKLLLSLSVLAFLVPQFMIADEKSKELSEQRKKEIAVENRIQENKVKFKAQMEAEQKKFLEMMKDDKEEEKK